MAELVKAEAAGPNRDFLPAVPKEFDPVASSGQSPGDAERWAEITAAIPGDEEDPRHRFPLTGAQNGGDHSADPVLGQPLVQAPIDAQ